MSAPAPAVTVAALVADAESRFGDDTAIVTPDGSRTTWVELAEQARGFGAALVASGIEVGDRVAIWAPNGERWIVAVLGLWQAGATLVPVNTRFKGVEAAEVLRRSGARLLVTVTDFLDVDNVEALETSGIALPHLDTIVVTGGPTHAPSSDASQDPSSRVVPNSTTWESFLARAGDAEAGELGRRCAAVAPDDVSDILFTSGTTGIPKGVVQTHARTCGVATDWVAMTGLTRGDRYLMVNPYFHMFGLKAGILACVVAGATMIPEPVFDVERVLTRIPVEEITVLPGPPTLYQSLLDHPEKDSHDLSSLRVAVTGAADIPVELIRRMDAELPFSTIITGYGLTEGGTAAATGPGDDAEAIATTVGRARPGFEIRIVDGDRNDVGPGETGEILLRGVTVMSHYLDDPTATAEAIDAEGWLGTGDLGVLDEDGRLAIVGRSKDMLIVGGFNVYPAEVENILLGHDDVAAVAVIGRPDDRLGEVAVAFVVRPGRGADEARDPEEVVADIIGWSREHMANFKVPRSVRIVDELPVNATGKVVKDELRALVQDLG